MENLLAFITVGLLVFDVVCIIISLAIDYWIYFDSDILRLYAGLWESCQEIKQTSLKTCADIEEDVTEHEAVRAMLFLALFLVIGAIAAILVKLFVAKEKKVILYAVTGLLVLAGLFLLIGFSVYHAEIYKPLTSNNPLTTDIDLHAGFAFCIISWLLTWGTAGLTAFVALRKE